MRDSFKIIDAHMHYNGIFKKDKDQPFIEYLDENGIDGAIVNTLNTTANMDVLQRFTPGALTDKVSRSKFDLFKDFAAAGQPSHAEVIELYKKYPKRIFPFFWYNNNDPNDVDQSKGLAIVKEAFKNGFRGIKIQPAMIIANMERLYPIAELLCEYDYPIFIHPSGGVYASPSSKVSKTQGHFGA
jgi:predicted TIM-barrel fold metal-dependent hydrolase